MNDQFITVIAEEDAEKRGHAGGRFYDGTSWESVAPKKKDPIEDPPKKKEHHNPLTFFRRRSLSTLAASKKDKTPVAPIVSLDDDDGDDGKILVTIPSFRGTIHVGGPRNAPAVARSTPGTGMSSNPFLCLQFTLTTSFLFSRCNFREPK